MCFYDRKNERQNIDDFFLNNSSDSTSKILCIEGDSGTGKTEFMKYIIKNKANYVFSISNQVFYKCDSIYANTDFSYISNIIYEIFIKNGKFFEREIEKYFSESTQTSVLETICWLIPQVKMFSFTKDLLEKKSDELHSFKSSIADMIRNSQLIDFFSDLIFSYMLKIVKEPEIFLCVDDIQWLDISSMNTLKSLLTKAKSNQEISISMIATIRSKQILNLSEKEIYNAFFDICKNFFDNPCHIILSNFSALTTFEIIQDNGNDYFIENKHKIFKITKGNPQEIFQALTLDSLSLRNLLCGLENSVEIHENMIISTENIMRLYGENPMFGPIINGLAILGCGISNVLLYKIALRISLKYIDCTLDPTEFRFCCNELIRRKIIKEKDHNFMIYHDSLREIVCEYLKCSSEYLEYSEVIADVILTEKSQIQRMTNSNLLTAIKLFQEVAPQRGFELFVNYFDKESIWEPDLCELVAICFCKCHSIIPNKQKEEIIVDNILPRLVVYSKLSLGENTAEFIYSSYKKFDKNHQITFLSNYIKILTDIGKLDVPQELCAVSLLSELLEIEFTDDNILINSLLLGMSVYEHMLNFNEINELFQRAEQVVSDSTQLLPETLARYYRSKGLVAPHKGLIQDYQKAVSHSREISDPITKNIMVGTSLNNLGLAYFYSGNINSALNCFCESLEYLEYIGNGVGRIYNNIGICYYMNGEYDKANSNLSIALNYEKEGNFTNICMLTNYALSLNAVGLKANAIDILDEINNDYLNNNIICKDTVCYSAALLNRAYIYLNDKDYMQAYALINKSTEQVYRQENELHQKKRNELKCYCLHKMNFDKFIESHDNEYLDLDGLTEDIFRKPYSLIPLAYYVI